MRTFNFSIGLLLFILLVQSCKKDDKTQPYQDQEELEYVYSALLKLGFDTVGVVIENDNIFVEEDIVLKKSRLFKTMPRQAVIVENTGVTRYVLMPFKYCISSSMNNHRVVNDAMKEIISVLPNNIQVTRVYNEADANLVIRGYDEMNDRCGYAVWPEFGFYPGGGYINTALYIGREVNINLFNWRNLNDSQRKVLIVHEVGHTLGIRHTDWRLNREDEFESSNTWPSVFGAYTVPNTNNSSLNPDPNSIFNSRNCGRSWGRGLTDGDKRAIRYVASGI